MPSVLESVGTRYTKKWINSTNTESPPYVWGEPNVKAIPPGVPTAISHIFDHEAKLWT